MNTISTSIDKKSKITRLYQRIFEVYKHLHDLRLYLCVWMCSYIRRTSMSKCTSYGIHRIWAKRYHSSSSLRTDNQERINSKEQLPILAYFSSFTKDRFFFLFCRMFQKLQKVYAVSIIINTFLSLSLEGNRNMEYYEETQMG